MRGVDVHGSKGAIDWRLVRSAGFEFAFVKATEGRTFDDERYAFNRRAARAAGIRVGAYHFARPDNNTPAEEVEHFLRVCQLQREDLLPVLDWEHDPPKAAWASEFLRLVEAHIDATPIFYTYPDFLRRTGSFELFRRYPLWFASYGPNDGNEHPVRPPVGFNFAVHQYTSNGRVPGISGNVDMNVLKLSSINALVYAPTDIWRGKLELYAGDELVAIGHFRDADGNVTPEARAWIKAVRANGGRGRVAPRPEGVEPHLEPPEHPEAEGFAGQWAITPDRAALEVVRES